MTDSSKSGALSSFEGSEAMLMLSATVVLLSRTVGMKVSCRSRRAWALNRDGDDEVAD